MGRRRGALTRVRSPLPALGAGGASALGFALALPPWDLVVLLAPAFLLLAAALHLLPEGPERPRHGALVGILFGGLHAVVALHWIPAAASAYMSVPAAMAAGLAGWGLHAAVAGMAFWAAASAPRLPIGLAAAGAWVVLATLPGALPLLALPWPGPEAALAIRPTGALLLPLLGSTGTGALLAGVAGWGLGGGGRRALTLVVVAVVWMIGDGLVEGTRGADGAPPSRMDARSITLVGLAEDPARNSGWNGVEGRGALSSGREAWPETEGSPGYLGLLTERSEREGLAILAGVHRTREGRRRNAGILLEPGEGGSGRIIHEKGRLVPGVERTHFLGPGEEGRGLAPGRRGTPVSWEGIPTGVLICFEVLFPGEVARLRHEGAELLLQLTGETALDPGRVGRPAFLPLLGDAPRRQHVAYLRARGVEFRMPVARTAVAGPTGGWDHRGRPLLEEELWERGADRGVRVGVPTASGPPPAIWIQPLSLPVGAALLLLGLGLGPRRVPEEGRSGRGVEP